jgi:tRNA (adenine22-N1)-methyltransferase
MKSLRINQLIDASSKTTCLADIGSDHGFYALQAITMNICQKVIICDIASAPLQRSIDLFTAKNIANDKASFFLSDGLLSVPSDIIIDAACIAGLSGQTIVSILSNSINSFRRMDYILLQPMQKADKLRQWLSSSGFNLLDEKICHESSKFFPIIKAKYSGNIICLSEIEKCLGPINLQQRSPLSISLCQEYLKRKKDEFAAKQSSATVLVEELARIACLIKEMEDYLK